MIVAVPDDRRAIVVGAGLLGLSAAWALSRRRWRVTVLEAANMVGHDRSGSKAARGSSGSGTPSRSTSRWQSAPAHSGATSRWSRGSSCSTGPAR